MRGRQAAACANLELNGLTIHRRGLQLSGHFYDVHTRMTDSVMRDGAIDYNYVQTLGLELSQLDRTVYDEVIEILRSRLSADEGAHFGDMPSVVTDKNNVELFGQLRTTLFFTLLRNFMGTHISIFVSVTDIRFKGLTNGIS